MVADCNQLGISANILEIPCARNTENAKGPMKAGVWFVSSMLLYKHLSGGGPASSVQTSSYSKVIKTQCFLFVGD